MPIKAYLETAAQSVSLALFPAGGVIAAEVNTVLPADAAEGPGRILMEVSSPGLQETVAFPVQVTSAPEKLEWVPETRDEPEGNYVLMQTSAPKPDADGGIVSLDPVNGRGLKMPFRDVMFLRAQNTQGIPLRVKATSNLCAEHPLPKTANGPACSTGSGTLQC
jgi:hypothetical protein